ncbi:Phage major capsid protein [Acetobacteraceae bacterium EV16G]|uniref:Phage major capsid protein n=1 Tax=Sorlinia euscelidii TaxID=3081148 RepID=A0ABU7U5G4_9PROT
MSEQDYKQAVKDLEAATDEVKRFADTAKMELGNLGKVSDETKQRADKALTEMHSLSTRVMDLEQKNARRGQHDQGLARRSLGQIVVESDEIKTLLSEGERFRGRAAVEVKAITSASSTGSSGTTGLVVADRRPDIVQAVPNRLLTIRDLLMPGTTSSNAIDYVRETLFDIKAAPVEENPSKIKPQSEITFELVTQGVKTIAHFVAASRQILADAPMLTSYIDGRLRYGLALAEEEQLLNGDGTGQNLHGLMTQATEYVAPAGVTVRNETIIDRLRLAMLQATLAQYPATGHVLNPTDWASIELTKDDYSRYIFANPTGLAGPTLWGLPVAESLSMKAGTFLTGAFAYAAQIFDRETAIVAISTEDRDNFVKNMVTILAEERLALAVYRPQALIKGRVASAPPSVKAPLDPSRKKKNDDGKDPEEG